MGAEKEFVVTFKEDGPNRGKYVIKKGKSLADLYRRLEGTDYDKVFYLGWFKKNRKQYKLFGE